MLFELEQRDIDDLAALISRPSLGINAAEAGRVYQLQVLLKSLRPAKQPDLNQGNTSETLTPPPVGARANGHEVQT
jgi:hypothetical protein